MNKEENYVGLYADFLKNHFRLARSLRVVADCSNGPAGLVLAELTSISNLDLTIINETPDPDFKAHGPNPLNPGATDHLVAEVLHRKADIGVIFDADADRAFFVDEKGHTLPSYIISVLLFQQNEPPFVADETVYKSLQHIKMFDHGHLIPSRVGSYYVKQELVKAHASVGAEYSGHYYYREFFNTDSGIFTMIQVLNTLSNTSRSLSEFCATLPPHSIKADDVKLTDKTWTDVAKELQDHYQNMPDVLIEHRDGITLDFGDAWISIRSSNTEPLLRLISGSESAARSTALITEIRGVIG